MGALHVPRFTAKKSAGFTLVEVLIALAIISIAVTASIKATSQTIRATIYLQDKTIAHWVGLNVMNEARLGLLNLPTSPDKLEAKTTALGQHWTTQAFVIPPKNPRIREIHVIVTHAEQPAKLVELVGYRYAV